MNYVSLPVHEDIPSIIDTCKNFVYFLESCTIVLHISRGATFTKSALIDELQKYGLSKRVLVNPQSVETSWGNIIRAHISNVFFIHQHASLEDKVLFHASNDLLVRSGLGVYLSAHSNLFHTRLYNKPNKWWPMSHAMQDQPFLDLCAKLGLKDLLVGGQIEGSVYTLELAYNISKLIETSHILENNPIFYPREEIFFPSLAYALGVRPTGAPYVYSEIHLMDKVQWTLWDVIDKVWRLPRGKAFLKRGVERCVTKYGLFGIKPKTIEKLISHGEFHIKFFDGYAEWEPYPSGVELFGVKRIPRDVNSRLRRQIRNGKY